jgi:hypothetical protein
LWFKRRRNTRWKDVATGWSGHRSQKKEIKVGYQERHLRQYFEKNWVWKPL